MKNIFSHKPYIVASLYQFLKFKNYKNYKQKLIKMCDDQKLKGSILIAEEGINATLAGKKEGINKIIKYLYDLGFNNLQYKEFPVQILPFLQMKIKIKKEIVTSGNKNIDPNKEVGNYIEAKNWNKLILNPNTILIDTRNDYEIEIGSFKNAINPNIRTFYDFRKFIKKNLSSKKEKPIAMYCTGGIRCEKSTSYMKSQGFKQLYHLKGGILNYLKKIPKKDSLWKGECFVFDRRISLNKKLEKGEYTICNACRNPVKIEDKLSSLYQIGISCTQCYIHKNKHQKLRAQKKQNQRL